jgi:hypothetical protein
MASILTSELRRIGRAGKARLKTNLAAFNAEVREFTNKMLPHELVVFHKKLVLQALRGIVKRTPVDTGRARGNWQVTIGSPASDIVDGTDKSGGTTIAQGLATVVGLRPFSIVWLTNNLPYAVSLEGGWSGQAPVGMVAVTIAELQTMFR